jgi:hypothetical protein
MSRDLQIREPETLPPARKPFGGRPRGARNRIQAELREQFEAYFAEHGPDSNPLIILADIARDQQVSPATREKAAHDLAKFLVPAQILQQREPEETSASSTVVIAALQSLLAPTAPLAVLPEGSKTTEIAPNALSRFQPAQQQAS